MESEALEPITSKSQSQADYFDNLKDKINKLLDEYGYPREVELNQYTPYTQETTSGATQIADGLSVFINGSYPQCKGMSELIEFYKYLKMCNGNDLHIRSIVSTPDNNHKIGWEKSLTIDGAATKIIMDATFNAIIKYDQECFHLWTKYLLNKDTTKHIELTDDDLDAILEYESDVRKCRIHEDIHKIGFALTKTYDFMVGYYGIFTPNKNGKPKQKDLAFLYDWCVIHGELPPLDGGNDEDKYNKVRYRMKAFNDARLKYGIGTSPKYNLRLNMARITLGKY